VHCWLIDQIDDTPAVLSSESEKARLQTKSDWWEAWLDGHIHSTFIR